MNDFRDIKDKKMVVDFGHMAVTSGLHENHFGGVLRTEEEGSLSGSESEIEMRKWRYWNLFINFKDMVCERKQRETVGTGRGGGCSGVERFFVLFLF